MLEGVEREGGEKEGQVEGSRGATGKGEGRGREREPGDRNKERNDRERIETKGEGRVGVEEGHGQK